MIPGEVGAAVGLVLGGSAVGGLVVTFLLRQTLPSVPFFRTWLFYGGLFAFLMVVVFWVGLS